MFEFHAFDDQDQVITHYDPFCWLIWPVEIVIIALATIKTSAALMHSDSVVEGEFAHYTQMYVPRGGSGQDQSRIQIIQTSSLAPFKTRTRYEDRDDYLDAKRKIKDQGFVFLGIKISVDKQE